jgi:PAS domain-containing protein
MRGLPLEPVARLRRALFPSQDSQYGWRLASVTVSLVSVGLIALTLAYRLRGIELPPALWVGLLGTFATVVLLLSKFLFWTQKEGGQFQGAFTTTEREFHSIFENALDAIVILDDDAICREANPAAESLFGIPRPELLGHSIHRFYKNSDRFLETWQKFLDHKFQQGDAELTRDSVSSPFVEYTAKADCLPARPARNDSPRRHRTPSGPDVAPRK